MLKILTIIFCVFVATRGFVFPGRFKNEAEATRWQYRHIHNMTENLIKDAFYKLRQAALVQSRYKTSQNYELGMSAAGIMDHWKRMLAIYRYYSNAKAFKNHNHTITQIMNAYAVIQSDYNEISHEAVLFFQLLEQHKQKEREEKIRIKDLAEKYKTSQRAILELMKAGMDVDATLGANRTDQLRRTMTATGDLNDTLLDTGSLKDEAFSSKMNGIVKEIETGGYEYFEFPKEKSFNGWVKKNAKNTKEAEYKKSLRYRKWVEKWDGFNPDIEGVNIPDKIVHMGLKNASDFFLTELKEDFI